MKPQNEKLQDAPLLKRWAIEKNEKCPVCLEEFKDAQTIYVMPCKEHLSCLECANKWKKSKFDMFRGESAEITCPTCRKLGVF
jgi:hypothetical protein